MPNMTVAEAQVFFQERVEVEYPIFDGANVQQRKKRALECLILRDILLAKFGLYYSVAESVDFFQLDGPNDGGCDQHIICTEEERVYLIQSKASNFQQDGTLVWAYPMNAGEAGRVYDYALSIQNGTARDIANQGGANAARTVRLIDRIQEIEDALAQGYELHLINIVTGTIAGEWENAIKPRILGEGWVPLVALSEDIAEYSSEALQLDAVGGPPGPITLNFLTNDSSLDDDDLVHGYIAADSLAAAVEAENWKLTKQNLRHFKGASATEANEGMIATLNADYENFHLFNNGLRITCDDFEVQGVNGNITPLVITNAQIVNGGQTSFSIRNYTGPNLALLGQVKVHCLLIKEDDDEMKRRIAHASNTQESLDKWDFHSDKQEQLALHAAIRNGVRFEVCGEDRAFYYEHKTGSWTQGGFAAVNLHRIPKVGQGSYKNYKIDQKDYSKAYLCFTRQPSIAKAKAKLFHKTSAGGLYNEIFIDNACSAKSLLYTTILLHQSKRKLTAHVADDNEQWHNQAITCFVSVFTHMIDDITQGMTLENKFESYFDGLEWEINADNGKDWKRIDCEKFDVFFNQFAPVFTPYLRNNCAQQLENPNAFFNNTPAYVRTIEAYDQMKGMLENMQVPGGQGTMWDTLVAQF